MNNKETNAFYDAFARRMSAELNAALMTRQISLEHFMECEALEDYDILADGMKSGLCMGSNVPELMS